MQKLAHIYIYIFKFISPLSLYQSCNRFIILHFLITEKRKMEKIHLPGKVSPKINRFCYNFNLKKMGEKGRKNLGHCGGHSWDREARQHTIAFCMLVCFYGISFVFHLELLRYGSCNLSDLCDQTLPIKANTGLCYDNIGSMLCCTRTIMDFK